jgi:hypothetical protein
VDTRGGVVTYSEDATFMTFRSSISKNISTIGYGSIYVSISIAVLGLKGFDKCNFEYSYNKGFTYILLQSLTQKENNEGFFKNEFSLPIITNNNENFRIRYRGQGRTNDSFCIAGETAVLGSSEHFAAAPTTGIMDTVYDNLVGSGDVKRKKLTFKELFSNRTIKEPIDLSAYAIPEEARNPTNWFQGPLGR